MYIMELHIHVVTQKYLHRVWSVGVWVQWIIAHMSYIPGDCATMMRFLLCTCTQFATPEEGDPLKGGGNLRYVAYRRMIAISAASARMSRVSLVIPILR
jgi:hypothetical protein